jgi:hypothetical protein
MTGRILFIRAHLIAFASYGFLTAIILSGVHLISNTFFAFFVVALVVIAIFGSIDESHRMWNGVNRGELERYGSVMGFCSYPRPGTSLLKALDKYANVQPQDIEEIKMQTCTFSNPYLKKLSAYFAENGVPNGTPIEVMGVGDVDDLAEVANYFPRLTVSQSDKKLSTHFNLIKAKGQYYLWFEPEHNDNSACYIPSKGAFLIGVQDEKLALERYEQDRSRDNFLVSSF